jgi:hypothetical protein
VATNESALLGFAAYQNPDERAHLIARHLLLAAARIYPDFLATLAAEVLPSYREFADLRARRAWFTTNLIPSGTKGPWDPWHEAFRGWAAKWGEWGLMRQGDIPPRLMEVLCFTLATWRVKGVDATLHSYYHKGFFIPFAPVSPDPLHFPSKAAAVAEFRQQWDDNCAIAKGHGYVASKRTYRPEHFEWAVRSLIAGDSYEAIANGAGLRISVDQVRDVVTSLGRITGLSRRRGRPTRV